MRIEDVHEAMRDALFAASFPASPVTSAELDDVIGAIVREGALMPSEDGRTVTLTIVAQLEEKPDGRQKWTVVN